jgi:hypothetical protein
MATNQTTALIQSASVLTEALLQQRPNFRPLLSIKAQLAYLAAYLAGRVDGARLKDMNFGLVAVREIEGWDDKLANQLYTLAAEVRKLTAAKP